jgi:hypothetical protein
MACCNSLGTGQQGIARLALSLVSLRQRKGAQSPALNTTLLIGRAVDRVHRKGLWNFPCKDRV